METCRGLKAGVKFVKEQTENGQVCDYVSFSRNLDLNSFDFVLGELIYTLVSKFDKKSDLEYFVLKKTHLFMKNDQLLNDPEMFTDEQYNIVL